MLILIKSSKIVVHANFTTIFFLINRDTWQSMQMMMFWNNINISDIITGINISRIEYLNKHLVKITKTQWKNTKDVKNQEKKS